MASTKAVFYQRAADGTLTTLATSTAGVSLTTGNWYDAKVVVDADPNDPNGVLQRLRFWVDGGQNGFDPNDLLLTSTVVDDTWPLTRRVPPGGVVRDATAELRSDRRVKGWSAGYVGRYRVAGGGVRQSAMVNRAQCVDGKRRGDDENEAWSGTRDRFHELWHRQIDRCPRPVIRRRREARSYPRTSGPDHRDDGSMRNSRGKRCPHCRQTPQKLGFGIGSSV